MDENDAKGAEDVRRVFAGLTEREVKVLRDRFGITFERMLAGEATLEDVGKQFEATRERIRRIEMRRGPRPPGGPGPKQAA